MVTSQKIREAEDSVVDLTKKSFRKITRTKRTAHFSGANI